MTRTIIEPKPLRNLMQTMVGQVVKALKAGDELMPAEKSPPPYSGPRNPYVRVKSRLELSGLYEFEGEKMVSLGTKVKADVPEALADVSVGLERTTDIDREGAGEVTFYFEIEGSV